MAVQPQFEWLEPFAAAPARASVRRQFGYIDRTGRWQIEPRFDGAGSFAGGVAWVKRAGRFAVINEQGAEVFTLDGAEDGTAFWHGLLAVRVGSLWGLVDQTGQWVHRPRFEELRKYTDTLQQVKADGKWGLINPKGDLVCPIKYDWFGGFQPAGRALLGVGPTGEGAALGLIDKDGRVILQPAPGRDFTVALEMPAREQMIFPRQVNFRWGFVDRAGAFVLEPDYSVARPLGEGMMAVGETSHEGLIDLSSGRLVIRPQYHRIERFSDGLAAFAEPPRGKMGYLDRTGKLVIEPRFEHAGPFKGGIAPISSYGPTGRSQILYIKRDGNYLWTPPDD